MNSILDTQIKLQIEGEYVIDMSYTDVNAEHLTLIDNGSDCYLRPLMMRAKKITKTELLEIINMCENSNIEQVRTSKACCKMSYDEFWNKYYNEK